MNTENQKARKQRGRTDRSAGFPIAPTHKGLPDDYGKLLEEIKTSIQRERVKVVLAGNLAMLAIYWDIGHRILERQSQEGWGAKVIDRLSEDLRQAFPDMNGFSPRNIKYMRAFAKTWPRAQIVQEPLAQLTWYHHLALMEKLEAHEERLWYAKQTLQHGWSRNILAIQIENQLHKRQGKAQNNFAESLPPIDSDMATQIFKDPYLFDFLGTASPRKEKELEQGLVDHVQKFLLELGQGFAFVGRQVHLELGDSDYYLDLLFYHLKLRRYVVIELKARSFEPGDSAQLGMYMTAVNRLLNHSQDEPCLGLLLVRERDRLLVEYALGGSTHPIGVAEWQTQLTRTLPEDLKPSLPSIEELEAEFSTDWEGK